MTGSQLAAPSHVAIARLVSKAAWSAAWSVRDRRGPQIEDALAHVLVGDHWAKVTKSGQKVSRVVQSLGADHGGATEVWISEQRVFGSADPTMTLLSMSLRAHRRWAKTAELNARGSL